MVRAGEGWGLMGVIVPRGRDPVVSPPAAPTLPVPGCSAPSTPPEGLRPFNPARVLRLLDPGVCPPTPRSAALAQGRPPIPTRSDEK
ncbi:hypothetical protein GCM10010251_72830 [Streptomyces aurantiogriseus]|uniref:Uncharacterized protein n=1 Tax=Streptomyces aurantiogriseus TaxID=66870 RepID=A0A918KY55_9ACTN|nr:hypothetical protein GCM10010251_72830 [Streptomyces aurantiogriseus]